MLEFIVICAVFAAMVLGLLFWQRMTCKRVARGALAAEDACQFHPESKRRSRTFLTFFRMVPANPRLPGGPVLRSDGQEPKEREA